MSNVGIKKTIFRIVGNKIPSCGESYNILKRVLRFI